MKKSGKKWVATELLRLASVFYRHHHGALVVPLFCKFRRLLDVFLTQKRKSSALHVFSKLKFVSEYLAKISSSFLAFDKFGPNIRIQSGA